MNTVPYNLAAREKAKMLSDDRVFSLRPKEGLKPVSQTGAAVDKRLFTGDNNLHAVRDIRKGVWFLRYDNGATPEGLKGEWSEFNMLTGFVTAYFDKRNIEVTSIL